MSASIIENAATEQNVAPAHAEKVLENSANYESTTEQEAAIFDPSINKEKTNDVLTGEQGFDVWQNNPYKAVEQPTEESQKYAALYELSKQPLYEALAKKYGTSLAYKTDVVLGHTRQTGYAPYRFYSAIVSNLNSMRVSATTKDMYQARIEGDMEKAARLEEQLTQQKHRLEVGPQPFEDEGWNTAAAFVASTIRNPEILALSAIGTAAAVMAAPAVAVAAGVGTTVASSALIFNDTYKLSMGELLPQLQQENPALTDAEAYELAKPAAESMAAMEVFFTAIGATVTGGQMLASSRAAARLALKAGIKKSGTQAIRDMPEFLRTYLKTQMPRTTGQLAGEYAKEVGGNITEEFMQQVMEEAALNQAKTGESFTAAFANRLTDFLSDPTAPRNAELLATIKNTAFGAGIVSGAMAAPGMVRNQFKNKQPTLLQRSKEATNNLSFAQQLFDWRQKNPVAKQSPEVDEAHSQTLVAQGIAPKTVRIDRQVAEEILATPEFKEAAKELQLQAAIEESEENGGTIDVDFVQYDKTVNSNKELFQKVRGAVAFTENSMSVNEFISHLDSLDSESLSEITKARETVDSVYNQVYEQQMQMGNIEEKLARANAITAQLISNRIGAFRVGQARTGEQAFDNVELRAMTEEEALSGLQQKTLDNAQQPVNIEAQGVRNEQEITSGTETTEPAGIVGRIRQNIREGNDGNVWVDAGTSGKTARGSKGKRVLSFTPEASQELSKENYSTTNYTVYDNPAQGAKEFLAAMQEAVAELGEYAASVDVKELKDYKDMKALILSEDKKTGCAVTKDGDIVSLFSSSPERGRAVPMLLLAVKNGGKKLDCFDIYLPKLYAKAGFKAVARNHWNEEYKPDGWNKELFDGYNHGEPDVVFMVYDASGQQQQYNVGDGVLIEGEDAYDKGMEAQDKALAEQEKQPLLQKDEEHIAGAFKVENGKLVIGLTAYANPTTLSHELFHWFSREMQDAFNSGEMTEYWAKQVKNLARMVGAKIENGKLTLTEAQEEHAANLFLTYIKEGKVENREIAPLFAYMQDLFRKACAYLKITGKLSKQADALFDSIFRAQDVIEHEQRMAGLIPVAKPDGADQELYDMYVGEMLASRMKATHDLIRKREAAKKYAKSPKYEAIRERTKDAVIKELSEKTEYQIKALAAEHDNNALETFMAISSNPELAALDLPVEQIEYILNNVPNIAEAAEKETERRMLKHVQEEFRLQPEQLGLDESRNTAKVKALLAESLMLSGKTAKDFDEEYKKVSAAADRQVAKTEIRRLKKSDYWDGLEANLVERYVLALGLKDKAAMAKHRRDQAIVNAIRMRAEAISKRYDRFVSVAETFEGAQQKVVHKQNGKSVAEYKYTAEAYDLLQSILEQFGFYIKYARRSKKPVAEKMVNWIADQEETTLTKLGELKNYTDFIVAGHSGDTDLMTGAEFDKLSTVFDGIKGVAGGEFAIMLKSEKIFLSDMVAATREHFDALGIEGQQKSDNFFVKEFGAFGKWTNPEPILRAIFPEKVVDAVWLPFIDAAVKAERIGRQWVDRYRAAKAKVDISSKQKQYSNGKVLSNHQVADLLLSMGNEHAYENFRLAFGLTEEQSEQIVSEALKDQPQLAEFVKEVWATYELASGQLEEEFEQRTNTLFIKKDHRAFEINGIQFGGGYVPARKALDTLRTDPRAANSIDMVHDKKFEKNVVAEADGNVLSIVDITENELFQSAKQGFTANEYNNVVKFMKQDGLHDTIGDRAYSFITDWIQAYQMPVFDTSGWARPLASLSTLSALGFRATTMILQLSGLFQSAASLGKRYFARGLMMALRNGEWAPVLATRKGADKSDYMAARIGDPRSSLLGLSILESVRSQSAKTGAGKALQYVTGKAGQYAMWGIQYFDTIVANITWNGAYLKALDQGKSEAEARRTADSEVRVVQSDSLQISRSAAMQSQVARMFTAFATWIMAMQSQLRAKLGTKQYKDAGVWALTYMIASPAFEALLKEGWASMTGIGDDDDDKDFVEKVMNTWYNQIIDTVGTSGIPVASLGAYFTKGIAAGIELGITDENDIFKVYQANVPALQVAGRSVNAVKNGIAAALSGDEDLRDKALINAASVVSSEGGKIVKMLLSGD